MTTQEMHENALRNVPYKYNQNVYFIDPLLGVIGGRVKEIYITLRNGAPEYSFKLLTDRHNNEYETITPNQLHRTNTDFGHMERMRYAESIDEIDREEATLRAKLNNMESQRLQAQELHIKRLKEHSQTLAKIKLREEIKDECECNL